MKIERLRVENLRCFEQFDFEPGPGVNWLLGPNGAGKTTVLEAAYLLSHGRSFRGGGRSAPCRHGTREYLLHAEVLRGDSRRTRLGLARAEDRWQARCDGKDLVTLGPLFEACPVVCFGPDSQTLVLGPAEERRNYLDWSVFHVEHTSLGAWRDWRRALRQRNALLRSGAPDAHFEPWEHDLARLAVRIDALRRDCLASLEPYLLEEAATLVPELGTVRLDYRPGWDTETGLAKQLAADRDRDRERNFTRHGAHRADWSLLFEQVVQREHLSRGQAKAIALVCMLAQTRWLRDRIGEYPLLCLDDMGSELDTLHSTRVAAWLADTPLQSWLTATKPPDATGPEGSRLFHVEHAGIKPVDAKRSPTYTL